MNISNQKTEARDISLFELLNTKKYIVDYFQREYRWQKKHIEQLLVDLTDAFLYNYKDNHEREEVQKYETYFMGPIILYEKNNGLSIIDGQQRLTSITLLLIYIHNRQKHCENKEDIESLIFSKKYNKQTYNIAIDERQDVLDSLYNKNYFSYEETELNQSIINMVDRYNDIKDLFPEKIDNIKLPYFIDWLKEKLIFVKIVAYSDRNAYTIFETMNDRGFNLTPSEMLKSYLISKVNTEDQDELNDIWRVQISKLISQGNDEDLEFFRAWLRGRYADTIRQTSAGATNEDFEKIGTSFHRWVKDKNKSLALTNSDSYYFFIKKDFVFYSNLYIKIKEAERQCQKGLEIIRYSKEWTIAGSLTYPLYIASINKTDSDDIIQQKLSLISKFIDQYVVIRSVNRLSIAQSFMRYTIYNLVKKIRGKEIVELQEDLNTFISELKESINEIENIDINQVNRKFIKYLLARLTLYLNDYCHQPIDFYDLITARRRNGCNLSSISPENEINEGSLANYILLRKDINRNDSKANILCKIFSGTIEEHDRESLAKNFTLPAINDLNSRKKFILDISRKIWLENDSL